MIKTVTLNPSLDYIVNVPNFKASAINRSSEERFLPGGKGINVSQVLTNLGLPNIALGVVGGFTGDYLVKLLKGKKINEDLIFQEDVLTRVNVKIRSNSETAINGQGPDISEDTKNKLLNQIKSLNKGDYLVLAGKIPPSMPSNFYLEIMKSIKNKDIEVVVDAEKEQLKTSLSYRPFLIKPNEEELGSVFDVEINSNSNVIHYAKELQKLGARNVLVSLGEKGAILITEGNKVYFGNSPKGELINSVGAGDSMVAGFLYGYLKENSFEEALKYGLSCGAASAFSEELATKEDVMKLIKNITIKTLEEWLWKLLTY